MCRATPSGNHFFIGEPLALGREGRAMIPCCFLLFLRSHYSSWFVAVQFLPTTQTTHDTFNQEITKYTLPCTVVSSILFASTRTRMQWTSISTRQGRNANGTQNNSIMGKRLGWYPDYCFLNKEKTIYMFLFQ